MRIGLISEHASPLADIGGVDSGGQNVYVAEVARHYAQAGHTVDVFTRRDDPSRDQTVDVAPGVRVVHVPAGPPQHIPKEELLEHMPDFSAWMLDWASSTARYDILHANFFMSGLAARDIKVALGIPYVVTFHALGAVRRAYQGENDRFPLDRVALEQAVIDNADRVIAECPQDETDLLRLYNVSQSSLVTVPCGVDVDQFRPMGKRFARARCGWNPKNWAILHVGRMVPRKGIDTVIEGVAELCRRGVEDVELVIVGGTSSNPGADGEVRRLMEVARREGIDGHVRFEGRIDHGLLPLYYGGADVFVTTPW